MSDWKINFKDSRRELMVWLV
uniref:Uncharacterized protein n=1 Tax=Arundo donax TaxID=35708 RepID=A0A0A8YSV8_ARUDO